MPTRIGGSRRTRYFSIAAAAVDESSTTQSAKPNGIVDVAYQRPPVQETMKTAKIQEMDLSSTSNTTRNTDFGGGSNSHGDELSTNTEEERAHQNSDDLSLGVSLDLSVPRPCQEVSWSESEGSTYISELNIENVAVAEKSDPIVEPDSGPKKSNRLPIVNAANDEILLDGEIDEDDGSRNSDSDNVIRSTEGSFAISECATIDGSEKRKASTHSTSDVEAKASDHMANCNPDNRRQPKRSYKVTPLSDDVVRKRGNTRHQCKEKQWARPPRPVSCCMSYSASNTTQNDPNHLDNVDYYSDVDVASRNDDISEVGFISKETTSSIFCRRLIPLEIPMENADDDLSAVSTINDSSRIPSVMGDDNSELAVRNAHQSAAEGKEAPEKDAQKRTLESVDYLPFVEVASARHNQDLSTVEYKLPYKIAHVAFEKTISVPAVIPIRNHQDDVSTIRGSVTPKSTLLMEICIPAMQHTMSSLHSASFDSIPTADNGLYGDEDSDDAVRLIKENTKTKSSNIKGRIDKKRPACDSKTDHGVFSKLIPQESQKWRHHMPQTRNEASTEMDTRAPNKSARRMNKGLQSLHHDNESSSTDARIRKLKVKLRAMQESSSLTESSKKESDKEKEICKQKMSPEKGSDAIKPETVLTKLGVKGDNIEVETGPQLSRKSSGAIEEVHQTVNPMERSCHSVQRSNDMNDRLELYDVDYLDTIDVASHDNDLSTVDIRFTQMTAKAAFVRTLNSVFGRENDDNSVPAEVSLKVQTVRSTSHNNEDNYSTVDDIEHGLCRKQKTSYKNGPKQDSVASLANEPMKFKNVLVQAKTRAVAFGRALKKLALDSWQQHTEGRSTNEKIVILVIGISFFVLVVLLFVAIAKR